MFYSRLFFLINLENSINHDSIRLLFINTWELMIAGVIGLRFLFSYILGTKVTRKRWTHLIMWITEHLQIRESSTTTWNRKFNNLFESILQYVRVNIVYIWNICTLYLHTLRASVCTYLEYVIAYLNVGYRRNFIFLVVCSKKSPYLSPYVLSDWKVALLFGK